MIHSGLQGRLQLLQEDVTVRIDKTGKQRQSLSADADTPGPALFGRKLGFLPREPLFQPQGAADFQLRLQPTQPIRPLTMPVFSNLGALGETIYVLFQYFRVFAREQVTKAVLLQEIVALLSFHIPAFLDPL